MKLNLLALAALLGTPLVCSAAPLKLSNAEDHSLEKLENMASVLRPQIAELLDTVKSSLDETLEKGQELLAALNEAASSSSSTTSSAPAEEIPSAENKDKKGGGGDVHAPKILYSVTVQNPGSKAVNVTVEYSTSSGAVAESVTSELKPGESRYFGEKYRSEGFWTSAMVVTGITATCGNRTSTLHSEDFGMATTTAHLSFSVTGAEKEEDTLKVGRD